MGRKARFMMDMSGLAQRVRRVAGVVAGVTP